MATNDLIFDWPDAPMDEIQMCLNCPRPSCINCLEQRPGKYQRSVYQCVDAEEFIKLYNRGLGICSMAEKLHMDRRTIKLRLDAMKAPYNPGQKRIKLTVEHIECLPEFMQHYFILKGVRL